jgi:hypothetical protein
MFMGRGNTMNKNHVSTRKLVIDTGHLALHVVKRMTILHKVDAPCTLDGLVDDLRVHRTVVREVLSTLHQEGVVDALHMRLTLNGFAIGHSLEHAELPPFRVEPLRPAMSGPAMTGQALRRCAA